MLELLHFSSGEFSQISLTPTLILRNFCILVLKMCIKVIVVNKRISP